ncbi:glutaredoxin 2 [Neisseriaceae bacterium B1]
MKLYIYDHCPFCVRARMIFGLRQVPIEEVILLNDDEKTPIDLIGAKQVPILEKPDGTHMGESLDIVRFIDEYAGKPRLDETIRPEIQVWFEHVNDYYNRLIMPRDVQLKLAEFATQSAIDYFVHKKEAQFGSFADNLAKTDEYLAQIHADLQDLDVLIASPEYANGQQESMEDILIFPVLRNLTMVKGIVFPEKTLAYIHTMSQKTGVNLYFKQAV